MIDKSKALIDKTKAMIWLFAHHMARDGKSTKGTVHIVLQKGRFILCYKQNARCAHECWEKNKEYLRLSRKKLYLCSRKDKKIEDMETTTTIKVPVNVPKYYSIDLLKEQLTAYAQQLIAAAKPTAKAKRPYRHEALCGIFNSEATEDQLIEDYLQEKYKL